MLCESISSLVQRDLDTVWHPFTQRKIDPTPICFVKAEGAYLISEEGERYLDGIRLLSLGKMK